MRLSVSSMTPRRGFSAIASLDSTLLELEHEIGVLIADMEASIAEANLFIDEMASGS